MSELAHFATFSNRAGPSLRPRSHSGILNPTRQSTGKLAAWVDGVCTATHVQANSDGGKTYAWGV